MTTTPSTTAPSTTAPNTTAPNTTRTGTTAGALQAAGLDPEEVRRSVATALAEDLRYGPDVTTAATVPADAYAVAEITPRQPGVLAGVPVMLTVFDQVMGEDYEVLTAQDDGAVLTAHHPAVVVRAPVRGLLTAERTALNFLCHLSGVATATARWVHALADASAGTGTATGTSTVVRDTRKTLPGLRTLEKYAVRCGGGTNHRMGLGDAILIKDNHIAAAGSVTAAMAAARAQAPSLHCEVEVDDLDQLAEAVSAGATEILLDNFTPDQCAQAVRLVRAAGSAAKLEASGGITLDTARAYAQTGVDYVSVGALTHSSPYLDLGLDLSRTV
ncbi:MAG TPA: carboxylating nicotinate-nucleotide diphosphorylase [Streptosporangiaceae bacterium]|jgi:nicotinate-nucleotide pyrophosphorylase (carboxylating)|nr:carboxylating nicotinate-nucleotide diphosphorylase [Streptosporangiaceae bacterium]